MIFAIIILARSGSTLEIVPSSRKETHQISINVSCSFSQTNDPFICSATTICSSASIHVNIFSEDEAQTSYFTSTNGGTAFLFVCNTRTSSTAVQTQRSEFFVLLSGSLNGRDVYICYTAVIIGNYLSLHCNIQLQCAYVCMFGLSNVHIFD